MNQTSELPELPVDAFRKADPSSDALFYAQPRLVTHIDEDAIAAVTALYRMLLPAGGTILDMMGSWVSHLPPEMRFGEVIGHGMNAEELAANPRLDRWFLRDLNAEPVLPLATHSLDAATICVSVQYLQRPVAVLRDLGRALRPGAPAIITFSNRCFPTKAVAVWQALGHGQHCRLVEVYLERAGFTEIESRSLVAGRGGDPLWAVMGRAPRTQGRVGPAHQEPRAHGAERSP